MSRTTPTWSRPRTTKFSESCIVAQRRDNASGAHNTNKQTNAHIHCCLFTSAYPHTSEYTKTFRSLILTSKNKNTGKKRMRRRQRQKLRYSARTEKHAHHLAPLLYLATNKNTEECGLRRGRKFPTDRTEENARTMSHVNVVPTMITSSNRE